MNDISGTAYQLLLGALHQINGVAFIDIRKEFDTVTLCFSNRVREFEIRIVVRCTDFPA